MRALVVTLEQVGSDVAAAGSGQIDLSGLSEFESNETLDVGASMAASIADLQLGSSTGSGEFNA